MLKTQIERILEMERDAKERIVAAELEAAAMLEEARALRSSHIEQARVAALAEAEALLQRATEEAAKERAGILNEARDRAQAYLEAVQRIELSFVQHVARSVAGLEP